MWSLLMLLFLFFLSVDLGHHQVALIFQQYFLRRCRWPPRPSKRCRVHIDIYFRSRGIKREFWSTFRKSGENTRLSVVNSFRAKVLWSSQIYDVNQMPATTAMFCNVKNIKCSKIQDVGTETRNTFKYAVVCLIWGIFEDNSYIVDVTFSNRPYTVASSDVDRHQKTKMTAR